MELELKSPFLKTKFGVRAVRCMTFFLLGGDEVIEWYSRNLAQPKVTILHLDGGFSSYKRTQKFS